MQLFCSFIHFANTERALYKIHLKIVIHKFILNRKQYILDNIENQI